VGLELAESIMRSLRLPNSLQNKVGQLILWHMFPCDPAFSDTALRRLINRVGKDHIKD